MIRKAVSRDERCYPHFTGSESGLTPLAQVPGLISYQGCAPTHWCLWCLAGRLGNTDYGSCCTESSWHSTKALRDHFLFLFQEGRFSTPAKPAPLLAHCRLTSQAQFSPALPRMGCVFNKGPCTQGAHKDLLRPGPLGERLTLFLSM